MKHDVYKDMVDLVVDGPVYQRALQFCGVFHLKEDIVDLVIDDPVYQSSSPSHEELYLKEPMKT